MIPSLSAQDAFVLFSVYDTTTGEVRRAGYVGDEESALAQAAEGEGVHLGAVLVEHYMRDGAPVPMGAKPSADTSLTGTHTSGYRSRCTSSGLSAGLRSRCSATR